MERLRYWGTVALVFVLLGGTIGGLFLQGAERCELGRMAVHEGTVEVCAPNAGRNPGTSWQPFDYEGAKEPWVREVAEGRVFACDEKLAGPDADAWSTRCGGAHTPAEHHAMR